MSNPIPDETIRTYARTIFRESQKYGFGRLDMVRLVTTLMDMSADTGEPTEAVAKPAARHAAGRAGSFDVSGFPLRSSRLQIRLANRDSDQALIQSWVADRYGQYFLLSCATAQSLDVASILGSPLNQLGIVSLNDGTPIGAVAFLDIDRLQRRAELRKLIGAASERGKGYAEEATLLWIEYGHRRLKLEKIYLSTLQTHLRNIQLNESIGFRIEGVLRSDIRLGNTRHDVLRMGLCFEPSSPDG